MLQSGVQQAFCMSFYDAFNGLCFCALVSLGEEAWEPEVAMAHVRIRLDGLGLTRF